MMNLKQLPFFQFLAICVCVLALACSKEDPIRIDATPSRTVLIYMVGDNSLSSYSVENMDSLMIGMKQVYSTANILVYMDNYESDPSLWLLTKNKRNQVIPKQVKMYSEQNSLDTEVMAGILQTAFQEYPSQEKYLVLWSHGAGWLPSSKYKAQNAPRRKYFGQDLKPSAAYQEIWDLRKTLEKTGVHFDCILFDACHMACVEVAYELKDVTDYILASPTEILGTGFPYREMIADFSRTQLNPAQLWQTYLNYYDGSDYAHTGSFALLSTHYLDELASVYRQIRQNYVFDVSLLESTQQYGRRSMGFSTCFYDLEDLINHLPLSQPERTSFDTALSKVILNKGNSAYFSDGNPSTVLGLQHCCDLSIFVPELNYNSLYKNAYTALRWYEAVSL